MAESKTQNNTSIGAAAADADDVGSGVLLGTNLQWNGQLGSVNALEAQRDAKAVIDAMGI